jgi:hypothetical protein
MACAGKPRKNGDVSVLLIHPAFIMNLDYSRAVSACPKGKNAGLGFWGLLEKPGVFMDSPG